MFELVDSQPSHLVGVDAINLTPGEKTNSLPNAPIFFFYKSFLPIITLQISQTQKGWSGSLTQKMKSLRSSPCEELRMMISCSDAESLSSGLEWNIT